MFFFLVYLLQVCYLMFSVLCQRPCERWGGRRTLKKTRRPSTKRRNWKDWVTVNAQELGEITSRRGECCVCLLESCIYTHVYDRHSLANTLSLFHHERLRGHYQISSPSHRVVIAAPRWYMHVTWLKHVQHLFSVDTGTRSKLDFAGSFAFHVVECGDKLIWIKKC